MFWLKRNRDAGGRRAAFRVLRHADYRRLLIATSISSLGAQFQFAAVVWWIYQLTGSEVALGIVSLVRFVPILLFGLFGGVIADRFDRRTTLIVSQLFLMVSSGMMAALAWNDSLSLGLIYGLTAGAAVVDCVAQPARSALIPALVPRGEMADAMSVNIMVGQTASIAGPAVAGFVIAAFGTPVAFAVDATGFVVAIGFLLAIRNVRVAARVTGNTWAAAVEGLRFLRRSPVLLGVMSVDFFATFFGATKVLLPVIAVDRFGLDAGGLGVMNSSIAVGALAGSVVVSALPSIERPGRGVLVAVGIFGLAILGVGLVTTFLLAIVFLAISGAADAVSMAQRHTLRNLVTPDALRGRISAAHSTFASGGPQLGDARAGAMAALIGAGPALVLGGAGVLLTVAIAHRLVPRLARTTLSEFTPVDILADERVVAPQPPAPVKDDRLATGIPERPTAPTVG